MSYHKVYVIDSRIRKRFPLNFVDETSEKARETDADKQMQTNRCTQIEGTEPSLGTHYKSNNNKHFHSLFTDG